VEETERAGGEGEGVSGWQVRMQVRLRALPGAGIKLSANDTARRTEQACIGRGGATREIAENRAEGMNKKADFMNVSAGKQG